MRGRVVDGRQSEVDSKAGELGAGIVCLDGRIDIGFLDRENILTFLL